MATYTEHYNLKKPQPSEYYAIADFNGNADVIDDELFKKVDKVTGKGLSTNDYTNADKTIVDGVTSALAGKVDKVTGKGLSSNDYTNADKGIVDGVTSALAGKVDTSLVGSANGVAELDANGRVPSSQLPSYVDDVLEYADLAHFPATGETGKIYIAEDTNKTYRWSGSDYAEISESLALGETSSTAYAGNKGKANADAIAAIKDGTNIDSFGDVETALAGKADVSSLADYASLDNSGAFSDANNVTKELVYINGFQSGLTNYPSEVSNTIGILFTRWFYYSGDLTVARMQLVFTLQGKSFCRFFDGTSWTRWVSNGVGDLSNLTTTDKSSVVGAINEVVDSLAEVVYASANVGGDYTGGTDYTLNSFTIVDSGTYLIIGKQYLTPDSTYNYVRPVMKIYKNNSMIAQEVYAIKQGLDITSVIHCNSTDVISLKLNCNNNISNLNTDNTASELRIVKLSNK